MRSRLRTHLSGNPAFIDLLARVRLPASLDAYTHQDLPFSACCRGRSNPERDLAAIRFSGVIQHGGYYSAGAEASRLRDGKAEPSVHPREIRSCRARAGEVDGCLELMLVYNADLFSEKRMATLLDEWLSLLDQIAAYPAKPIDQFLLDDLSEHVVSGWSTRT